MTGEVDAPAGRIRAFEDVILTVEADIEAGRLVSGDKLPPERELADWLGVSRASVREALRVLEMFGVVQAKRGAGPDSGSIIADSTHIGLLSTLRLHKSLLKIPSADFEDLRDLLEGHAAELAASKRKRDTRELKELVASMADKEYEEFYALDVRLHIGIAQLSGNALLPLITRAVRQLIAPDLLLSLSQLSDWPLERALIQGQHERVLECIDAGDADGAQDAMHTHMLHFYERTRVASRRPKRASNGGRRRS